MLTRAYPSGAVSSDKQQDGPQSQYAHEATAAEQNGLPSSLWAEILLLTAHSASTNQSYSQSLKKVS